MTLVVAHQVDIATETEMMSKIIRQKCGGNIMLSYVDNPAAGYFIVANATKQNRLCIKVTILENIGMFDLRVRPALIAFANKL